MRFFSLNSNSMDWAQMEWLEKELSSSGSDWKIAFFHHPFYSSGEKHGPDEERRRVLEPLFVKYGVSVVFKGHEHFYERLKPQKASCISSRADRPRSAKEISGARRKRQSGLTPSDTDNTFMLCEIGGDRLSFQTITRTGRVIDSGVFDRTEPVVRSAGGAKD